MMSIVCNCAVIRNAIITGEPFSPYKAAFSERDKTSIKEHDRLMSSLMSFKKIDWEFVMPPKIVESDNSSS